MRRLRLVRERETGTPRYQRNLSRCVRFDARVQSGCENQLVGRVTQAQLLVQLRRRCAALTKKGLTQSSRDVYMCSSVSED